MRVIHWCHLLVLHSIRPLCFSFSIDSLNCYICSFNFGVLLKRLVLYKSCIKCIFFIFLFYLLLFFIVFPPIADMRGFMTSHGQPDQSRSARYILKDYVSVSANKINYFNRVVATSLVNSFAALNTIIVNLLCFWFIFERTLETLELHVVVAVTWNCLVSCNHWPNYCYTIHILT